MSYWKKKQETNKISEFELKRFAIWRFFSLHLDTDGQVLDKAKFINKSLFIIRAGNKFNKSPTQIKRLIKQFVLYQVDECEKFIKHKNKAREPWNKTNNQLSDQVLKTFSQYSHSANTIGINNQAFIVPFTIWDYYTDYEAINSQISYATVQRILNRNNLCSPFAHKRTKKLIAKNLNSKIDINQEFLEAINQAIKYRQKQHHSTSKKTKMFGEIVEIDGCDHLWVPSIGKCNILAIVDASSGKMLSASLDHHETNYNYINAISSMVKQYGLPQTIYGDKRKGFFSNDDKGTRISRPLHNLGVVIDCESYAKHKPHIERTWDTLQKSLPNYLLRNDINTYQAFKYFVENKLCDWYNTKYRKQPGVVSKFKSIEFEIFNNSFCVCESKKVFKGNYIKVENKFMAPYNDLNQRIVMYPNGHVNIYSSLVQDQNKGWYIRRGTTRFYLKEIDPFIDEIDFESYDAGAAINDANDIIWTLKDKLFLMNEEMKRLKMLCLERGVDIN